MFRMMFYTGLLSGLFFLVCSVIFFVRNHVAKLIGDVTGWNARKSIKQIYVKNVRYERTEEEMNIGYNVMNDKTVMLCHEECGTMVLTDSRLNEKNVKGVENRNFRQFEIEEDIMIVHTDAQI